MVAIQPVRIPGRWRDGRALDVHTVSSTYVGDDEFGHARFDTRRSAMGELLYRLKYRADRTVIQEVAEAAASFVNEWCPHVEVLVPVPPSRERAVQPVLVIGAAIAVRLGIESLPDCVRRTRDVPQLKDVFTTMSGGDCSMAFTTSTGSESRAGGFCYSTICSAPGQP
jgi:predicted amidophosphoribosyltransferase